MKKILLLFLLVSCTMATAQDIKKKCKTCGKPISECSYKGVHPKPENPTPSKPDKPTPSKPTTGTLSITSTPSDASVKIDGRYLGTTPLTLDKQKAGTYKVTFSAEGYETVTKSVTVTAGKTATCSATLKKKQAPQPAAPQPAVQQPTTTTTTTPSTTTSAPSQTITANGVSFKMIRVDGGTFTMGATSEQGSEAYDNEKPAHQVTLSSYHIGETEVTQSLWEAVMGSNPSDFKGANRPVENVSWDDCQTFISKLNAMTGKTFRLPTEAEWEFASRGGNRSKGYKYSGSNTLDEVCWFWENSGNTRLSGDWSSDKLTANNCRTHDVKTKSPNELGIYDMSGNVWEWCQDWYGKDYYSSSPQSNPQGPSSGSYRVDRGGSWFSYARLCRVSYRGNYTPGRRFNFLGLRLAL